VSCWRLTEATVRILIDKLRYSGGGGNLPPMNLPLHPDDVAHHKRASGGRGSQTAASGGGGGGGATTGKSGTNMPTHIRTPQQQPITHAVA
jgi:hypothetical protein